MRKALLAAAFAASTFSGILQAQGPIRMIGGLAAVPGGYSIVEIEGTTVLLAADVELLTFVNRTVDVTGSLRDDPNSPTAVFDVTSIKNSSSVFTTGSARIGRMMSMRVKHDGPSQFFVFLSLAPAHTPLESYAPIASGTLWVDPIGLQTIAGGLMFDRWDGDLAIPNDPSLIGLTCYLQAAAHSPMAPLLFQNGKKITIGS
jgi:hypothetical protein